MVLEDFEYDGISLKEMGYSPCNLDNNSGLDTIQLAPEISFATTPLQNGLYNVVTNASYSEVLTATIQICKSDCNNAAEDFEISIEEMRNLARWLNRKQYLPVRLNFQDYETLYTNGSFGISRMEIDGKIYGVELTLTTDSPYLRSEERTLTYTVTANSSVAINIDTDEEGIIYPEATITLKSAGTLTITNNYSSDSSQSYITKIDNCKSGEILTFVYPIITSNYSSHKIMDDFNWSFPRFSCSMLYPSNKFTFSLPCTVEFKYSPIVKVGI